MREVQNRRAARELPKRVQLARIELTLLVVVVVVRVGAPHARAARGGARATRYGPLSLYLSRLLLGGLLGAACALLRGARRLAQRGTVFLEPLDLVANMISERIP